MGYAIKADGSFRSVTEDMELFEGETYYEEVPQWAWDLQAAAAVLAAATSELNRLIKQANAQVAALVGRITVLDWLINLQDPEDPEYVEPTAEDSAELAACITLRNKWLSYSNKLPKVKLQATWPDAPVWPVMPALYMEGLMAIAAPAPATV
jgi:hypothetical protein